MRLAIVGSRNFTNYTLLKEEVFSFILKYNLDKTPITIVSGGAVGCDSLGERVAEEMSWDKLIFLPQWDLYGRSAGIRRNEDIVNNSDALIAFRVDNSKGTTNSIERAKKRGIKVRVIDLW